MSAPTFKLNGEDRPLRDTALSAILRDQDIDGAARGVAVAVNGAVVPRRAWAEVALRPGDEVEIVKLFAGG